MPTTSEAVRLELVSKRYNLREGETLKETLGALLNRRRQTHTLYALSGVSFHVGQGETLGIIGRNGCGKTTTLKLIAGVTRPTRGRITVNGRVSPLLELSAGFHPDFTGRENVFLNGAILGMAPAQIKAAFDDIVSFSGLEEFMDTPVKRYSSGMFVRLGFAIAMHSNPDIFLIDESLSVGDAEFREKCLERVRQHQRSGGTIILVSHDMNTISEFCDRALFLEGGNLLFDGSPAAAIAHYQESLSASALPTAPGS